VGIVAEGQACRERALGEANDHGRLRLVSGDQKCDVNGSSLPDAVHAAGSLLEPDRIPRQLEVDDYARASLKIQPETRDIGGNED
jgi:hypothetical protein